MPFIRSETVIGIVGRPIKPLKRYVKKLKPWQVEAILMGVQGHHYDDIADKFGVSQQIIGNLLRTKQALEIRDRVNARVMKQAMEAIPDTVKQIQVTALQNMQRVLSDEKLQKASPMALFDKSAKALEVMSKINPATLAESPQPQGNVQVNNIFNILEQEEQKNLHTKIVESISVAEAYSWISGDSVDGTGTVTSATRQLPNPENSGENAEISWAGLGERPKVDADQSEDGPVLPLNGNSEVHRSEP